MGLVKLAIANYCLLDCSSAVVNARCLDLAVFDFQHLAYMQVVFASNVANVRHENPRPVCGERDDFVLKAR